MTEHAAYIYSTYSKYFSFSDDQIYQIGRNNPEDSHPIPSFDENLLINLCNDAKNIFENEDIILKIEGDTTFVGDIHGSFHDLLRIINHISDTPNKIVFLGDYVDRGNFSLECITLLFTLKVMFPDKYFLLRGNHEFDATCCQYGFKKEILNYHNPKKIENFPAKPPPANYDPTHINLDEELSKQSKKNRSPAKLCDTYFANHVNIYCYKYSEDLYDAFLSAFSHLPISAIVNDTTFCIHGGLSPHLDKIEKIQNLIKRPIFDFDENQLLTDLLWSDPSPESENLFAENPRGKGQLFNKTATIAFLKINNMQRMIRGHECVNEGVDIRFNEKCITVFSSSSYDRDNGNKSAIVELFQKDDRINSIVFCPFDRLKKFDALYYKVEAFGEVNNVPVLSRFLSGPTYEPEKFDQAPTKLKLSSRKRRASFNQAINSFNTGFKAVKRSQCLFSPKDAAHNNIPRSNHWRFSDECAAVNPACLPLLSRKATV